MASKTNEGADSSVVLTPFFDGTDFEYWKIRMRTHLKAEGLQTIVANGFEEPENNGDLTAAEMKNLEAKYCQDAKVLSKIQIGVSRAYFARIATCETAKEAWDFLKTKVYGDEKVRTINLQTLSREFQNLKMIESEKIDEYCTRVMNIVNEMRNHSDTISDQQVVEKKLVLPKSMSTSLLSLRRRKIFLRFPSKSQLDHFVHRRSENFFVKINQKRWIFTLKQMRVLKIS